jgi:peptidoglycan/LPS O-acetylase OafA/YrhL
VEPKRDAAAPKLEFRPDIEGLRAIAVAMVVLLHAGVSSVSGGYAGVDVFFVISGFLITSLTIAELQTTSGVSILGFYARRARRILPAASVVIAATIVASYLVLGVLRGRATAIDGRWAALFGANFHLIQQGTDYFARTTPPSLLQHYWSLAVEEQFYLAWPTALLALFSVGRFFRRPTLAIRVGLIALIGISLYWSVAQTTANPTSAYFSPFTRAWELAAGALVAGFATAILRIPSPLRAAATWIGLAGIGLTALLFDAATPFPGSAALLPVCATVFVIAGGMGQPKGSAARALGVPSLRWLGKISFALYLWHWPLLMLAEQRSNHPIDAATRAVCVAVAVALSQLTVWAIENPIRRAAWLSAPPGRRADWQRTRRPLAVGAAFVLVAVTVSTVTVTRADRAIAAAGAPETATSSLSRQLTSRATREEYESVVERLVREGLTLRSVPRNLIPPVLKMSSTLDTRYSRCLQLRFAVELRPCVFGDRTSSRVMVVFGDSHAMEWMPALDLIARQARYKIVTMYKSTCTVASIDTYVLFFGHYVQCNVWRMAAIRRITSMQPAMIVIATDAGTTAGTRFVLSQWLSGLRDSLDKLTSLGAKVVDINTSAFLPIDPGACLSRPKADPSTCPGRYLRRDLVDAEAVTVRAFGGTFIDTEPWFCYRDVCPMIIDNRIAYHDVGHISAQYAVDLAPLLNVALLQ